MTFLGGMSFTGSTQTWDGGSDDYWLAKYDSTEAVLRSLEPLRWLKVGRCSAAV